jgi:hypothetical protein
VWSILASSIANYLGQLTTAAKEGVGYPPTRLTRITSMQGDPLRCWRKFYRVHLSGLAPVVRLLEALRTNW